MANKNPSPGVTYDPDMAYIILKYLKNNYQSDEQSEPQQAVILTVITQFEKEIHAQLGKAKTEKLDSEINKFDFKKLDTNCG